MFLAHSPSLKSLLVLFAIVAIIARPSSGWTQDTLDVRSDGSDGAFEPALDGAGVVDGVLTVNLAAAPTADWKTPGDGRGVYDPVRWAVVFKYTSVTIPEGLTVRFRNHPKRAPVVWLVDGDVTIAGRVELNGDDGRSPDLMAEPGPGGFRGGAVRYGSTLSSAGLGPGGGQPGNGGKGGGYGTPGSGTDKTYGNPSILPLVGGSGGGGHISVSGSQGAGAGGGAILIATARTLTLAGRLTTNGGSGYSDSYSSGGGSGGAIRLVAATLAGRGTVEALGGSSNDRGGSGRIRIERLHVDEGSDPVNPDRWQIVPEPSVVNAQLTPRLWLVGDDGDLDAPQVRIVSVGGVDAPPDPDASFGARGHDIVLAKTATVQVVVETKHVEEASVVQVRLGPRVEGATTRDATRYPGHPDDDPANDILYWVADMPVPLGAAVVQVHVVRP